jgi:dienelactone hydrolase
VLRFAFVFAVASDIATYGWKERYDTSSIVSALYGSEKVRHVYALGVSMGAGIALQSAAVEPRMEGVVAEDPFANIREVSYDYAGLNLSPLLGKTLFRMASISAVHAISKAGGFDADDVSPEKAVANHAFPVLLICGTKDHRIPCRHAEAIFQAAIGPKQLWIVQGADHASAYGQAPAEYEKRVIDFFEGISAQQNKKMTSNNFEDENDSIVFVRASTREKIDLSKNGIDNLLRGQRPFSDGQFHQPLLSEFLGLGIHGFGNPVGAGYNQIARV